VAGRLPEDPDAAPAADGGWRQSHRRWRLLWQFLRSQRRYYTAPAREPAGPADWDAISRAATARLVRGHEAKVVVLSSPARYGSGAGPSPGAGLSEPATSPQHRTDTGCAKIRQSERGLTAGTTCTTEQILGD
jgi:hypothetical protein